MLTCACGTRFEVDDTLAGQEVLCPESQQPLRAPASVRPPRRTSGWALASVLLALIGAFTVAGTLAAIVLGVIALVSISRQRQHLAGTGFAVLGICLGVLFTVLTLVALSADSLFGLESWMRQQTMTAKVDTSGPLEIVRGRQRFAITRPSEKWGQVSGNQSDDAAVGEFQDNLDLLLMQIRHPAFLDVRTMPDNALQTLEQCEAEILAEFNAPRRPRNPFDDDEDEDLAPPRLRPAKLQGSNRLDAKDGMEGREMNVEVFRGGKTWHFLIRLYRRGKGQIYVVRAYIPQRRFKAVRAELQTALDSFRILPR
jgi:hypothetical protein